MRFNIYAHFNIAITVKQVNSLIVNKSSDKCTKRILLNLH